MIFLLLACLTNGTYGTGELNPSDEGYQWGSSSNTEQDSGETTETGSATSEPDIGYSVGSRAPNFYATDQLGNPWSLYNQNTAILLVFGHMDSTALPMMLNQAQELNDDVLTATLVGRNIYSSPASTSDAAGIASDYSIDLVLTDSSQALVNEWSERNPPKAYLISADHIVLWSAFQTLDSNTINQLLE